MSTITVAPELIRAINTLFTRSYYSAAGYVFESQPYAVEDDEFIYPVLNDVRKQERQHSRMIAQVLESLGRVPEAGAFPYWYLDLNYLSLPYMANFVVESLEHDVGYYEDTIKLIPDHLGLVRTMIGAILSEKRALLEELRPVSVRALEAEAKRYDDERAAFKKELARKKAAAKAAKEAARGAGAKPALAGFADPNEPGISNKEKARRYVLRRRAELKGGGAAPAGGASFEDAAKAKGLLDPTEDGISNKEKGKRRVLWNRFKKEWEKSGGGAGGGGGQTLEQAAAAAGVLDPDEEGISNKEKGKRKVLWNRFKKKWEAEQAAGGGGGGGGQTLEQAAAAAGVLDPNEDGLDNKEKGKRKVLWNRFKKKWEAEQAAGGGAAAPAKQTLEQAAAAAGVLDPEEPGLDNKEKGKRKVLWNRFKKKWEAEQGS